MRGKEGEERKKNKKKREEEKEGRKKEERRKKKERRLSFIFLSATPSVKFSCCILWYRQGEQPHSPLLVYEASGVCSVSYTSGLRKPTSAIRTENVQQTSEYATRFCICACCRVADTSRTATSSSNPAQGIHVCPGTLLSCVGQDPCEILPRISRQMCKTTQQAQDVSMKTELILVSKCFTNVLWISGL